jgi:hypothetical protein
MLCLVGTDLQRFREPYPETPKASQRYSHSSPCRRLCKRTALDEPIHQTTSTSLLRNGYKAAGKQTTDSDAGTRHYNGSLPFGINRLSIEHVPAAATSVLSKPANRLFTHRTASRRHRTRFNRATPGAKSPSQDEDRRRDDGHDQIIKRIEGRKRQQQGHGYCGCLVRNYHSLLAKGDT